ncbi:MAG: phage holin family protein [Clostridiales bacterium]|jgi:hypothetical protein|nr:phage holin family protein [Clostridiales bacterium]
MPVELSEWCITVVTAAMGALARVINHKNGEPFNMGYVAGEIIIAVFVGLLMRFLAKYFQWDSNLAYLFAGLSGWAGPHSLNLITKVIAKHTGIDLDNRKKEDAKADGGEDGSDK